MKERKEIKDEFKWDITKFCKNDEDFYNKLEKLKPYIENIKQFEGKLSDDDSLLRCWEACDEFSMEAGLVECYVYFKEDQDQRDSASQEMSQKLAKVLTAYGEASSYISPEIAEFSLEKLEGLKNKPEIKPKLTKFVIF